MILDMFTCWRHNYHVGSAFVFSLHAVWPDLPGPRGLFRHGQSARSLLPVIVLLSGGSTGKKPRRDNHAADQWNGLLEGRKKGKNGRCFHGLLLLRLNAAIKGAQPGYMILMQQYMVSKKKQWEKTALYNLPDKPVFLCLSEGCVAGFKRNF